MIVEASIQPLADACRILKSQGLSGPVELWDEVRPFALLQATVEYEASISFVEGDHGLRAVKWRPIPELRGQRQIDRMAEGSTEIAPSPQMAAGGSTVHQETEEIT